MKTYKVLFPDGRTAYADVPPEAEQDFLKGAEDSGSQFQEIEQYTIRNDTQHPGGVGDTDVPVEDKETFLSTAQQKGWEVKRIAPITPEDTGILASLKKGISEQIEKASIPAPIPPTPTLKQVLPKDAYEKLFALAAPPEQPVNPAEALQALNVLSQVRQKTNIPTLTPQPQAPEPNARAEIRAAQPQTSFGRYMELLEERRRMQDEALQAQAKEKGLLRQTGEQAIKIASAIPREALALSVGGRGAYEHRKNIERLQSGLPLPEAEIQQMVSEVTDRDLVQKVLGLPVSEDVKGEIAANLGFLAGAIVPGATAKKLTGETAEILSIMSGFPKGKPSVGALPAKTFAESMGRGAIAGGKAAIPYALFATNPPVEPDDTVESWGRKKIEQTFETAKNFALFGAVAAPVSEVLSKAFYKDWNISRDQFKQDFPEMVTRIQTGSASQDEIALVKRIYQELAQRAEAGTVKGEKVYHKELPEEFKAISEGRAGYEVEAKKPRSWTDAVPVLRDVLDQTGGRFRMGKRLELPAAPEIAGEVAEARQPVQRKALTPAEAITALLQPSATPKALAERAGVEVPGQVSAQPVAPPPLQGEKNAELGTRNAEAIQPEIAKPPETWTPYDWDSHLKKIRSAYHERELMRIQDELLAQGKSLPWKILVDYGPPGIEGMKYRDELEAKGITIPGKPEQQAPISEEAVSIQPSDKPPVEALTPQVVSRFQVMNPGGDVIKNDLTQDQAQALAEQYDTENANLPDTPWPQGGFTVAPQSAIINPQSAITPAPLTAPEQKAIIQPESREVQDGRETQRVDVEKAPGNVLRTPKAKTRGGREPVDKRLADFISQFRYLRRPDPTDPLYKELTGEHSTFPKWRWKKGVKYTPWQTALEAAKRQNLVSPDASRHTELFELYTREIKTVGQLEAEEDRHFEDLMMTDIYETFRTVIKTGKRPASQMIKDWGELYKDALKAEGKTDDQLERTFWKPEWLGEEKQTGGEEEVPFMPSAGKERGYEPETLEGQEGAPAEEALSEGAAGGTAYEAEPGRDIRSFAQRARNSLRSDAERKLDEIKTLLAQEPRDIYDDAQEVLAKSLLDEDFLATDEFIELATKCRDYGTTLVPVSWPTNARGLAINRAVVLDVSRAADLPVEVIADHEIAHLHEHRPESRTLRKMLNMKHAEVIKFATHYGERLEEDLTKTFLNVPQAVEARKRTMTPDRIAREFVADFLARNLTADAEQAFGDVEKAYELMDAFWENAAQMPIAERADLLRESGTQLELVPALAPVKPYAYPELPVATRTKLLDTENGALYSVEVNGETYYEGIFGGDNDDNAWFSTGLRTDRADAEEQLRNQQGRFKVGPYNISYERRRAPRSALGYPVAESTFIRADDKGIPIKNYWVFQTLKKASRRMEELNARASQRATDIPIFPEDAIPYVKDGRFFPSDIAAANIAFIDQIDRIDPRAGNFILASDSFQKAPDVTREEISYAPTAENITSEISNLTPQTAMVQESTALKSEIPPWPEDFPEVYSHTSVNAITGHAKFKAAKSGDPIAAQDLVNDLTKNDRLKALAEQYPDAIVVPVHAEEATGRNQIPAAYAEKLEEYGLEVADDIVQINRTFHRGAGATERFLRLPLFDGKVLPGRNYIGVDDVGTTGSTFAGLRNYIESQGAHFVAATTLANGSDRFGKNAKYLAIRPVTIDKLAQKFDITALEEVLRENGYPTIRHITDSQGQHFAHFRDVDSLRSAIAEAKLKGLPPPNAGTPPAKTVESEIANLKSPIRNPPSLIPEGELPFNLEQETQPDTALLMQQREKAIQRRAEQEAAQLTLWMPGAKPAIDRAVETVRTIRARDLGEEAATEPIDPDEVRDILRTEMPREAAGLEGQIPEIIGKMQTEATTGAYGAGEPARPVQAGQTAMRKVLQLPEMVRLARLLLHGKIPKIRKKLRAAQGEALGIFQHGEGQGAEGAIELKAGIFDPISPDEHEAIAQEATADAQEEINQAIETGALDEDNKLAIRQALIQAIKDHIKAAEQELYNQRPEAFQALKTLAHEIGHLWDWLDDKTLARGNIMGHIGALREYTAKMLPELPGGPEEGDWITKKERESIRSEAAKTARAEIPPPGRHAGAIKAREKKVQERTSAIYKERLAELAAERNLATYDEVMTEVLAVQEWWRGAQNVEPKEIMADMLSVLINNPGELELRAPTFFRVFENWRTKRLEVENAYNLVMKDLEQGISTDKLRQDIRAGFEEGEAKEIELSKQGETTWSEIRQAFKTAFIDRYDPIYTLSRTIGERQFDPANPRWSIENMLYKGATHELYLRQIGNRIMRPLKAMGLDDRDLAEYMLYNRVIGERFKYANPFGTDPAAAEKALANMEEKLGTAGMKALEKAQEEFVKIRNEVSIPMIEKSEIWSPEFLEKVKDNDAYATFNVVEYLNRASGTSGGGVGSKIYRQIGTLKAVKNVLAATMLKDMSLISASLRNTARQTTVDYMRENFPGEIQQARVSHDGKKQIIIEPTDPKQGLIVTMKEGKPTGWYVPREIADAFDSEVPDWLAKVERALSATTVPFRLLFTDANPGFWISNVIRDYFNAVRRLPGATAFAGKRALWRQFTGGIKPSWRRTISGLPDKTVDEMLARNELISVAEPLLTAEERETERLLARAQIHLDTRKSVIEKPLDTIAAAWDAWLGLGKLSEAITKTEAHNYLEQFYPDMNPELKAHIVRQAGSPAFLRKGRGSVEMNTVFLFANAAKEGWRLEKEMASGKHGQSRAEYWRKLFMYGILPKLIQWGLYSGVLWGEAKLAMRILGGKKDEKRDITMGELYERIPEADLTNYLCIPIGITATDKVVYLRFPQDETSRMVAGGLWKALKAKDVSSAGELGRSATEVLGNIMGDLPRLSPAIQIPTAIGQFAGGQNPYDWFRGGEMIPEKAFQAGGRAAATEFGKKIWGMAGGGILHRFKTDDPTQVRTELEKIVEAPGLSNLIGRFLKVSDRGVADIARVAKQKVLTQEARQSLIVDEAARKILAGEAPDLSGLAPDRLDSLANKLKDAAEKKAMPTAWLKEYVKANTPAEKIAVLEAWSKRMTR